MKISFFLFLLLISVGAQAEDRPKYGSQVTRLYHSHEFFKKHEAPDFWALIPYYVPQKDAGSCAPAATSMVINALRANRNLKATDELATQVEILKKVDFMKIATEKGIKGASLPGFKRFVEQAMKEYGITGYDVEMVQIKDSPTPEFKKALIATLEQNEKSDQDFIVPEFFQSDLTGDPEGQVGHFAPIAAYDSGKKKVLMLDPDRQWYEPYWVSVDTLIQGMANPKTDSFRPGGYVWIKKKRPL